jgi:glycosyltransferase involved in cell wall biosynthesis
MPAGAVIVACPSAAYQAPGGGEVQLVQTSRHLERLGWTVRPFVPWIDSLRDARLLHLFGMSPEGLSLARCARSYDVPVVLSPICWYEPAALVSLASTPARSILALAAWTARRACPRLPGWRTSLLHACDRVLPNSVAEAEQLVRLFGIDRRAIRIIPNGVEPRAGDSTQFRSGTIPSDFVLYAGRIEPRKNVLGLVVAARQAGLPLVTIGDPVPGHEGYAHACRDAGRDRVTWIPRLEHDDPRLAAAYAAARVFALPSWFETPGLAALEAGLAGTPLVITPLGCTREYFASYPAYAHPARPREISQGLSRAWELGRQPDLARWIGTRYLWAHVARQTAEVYHELER